MIEGKVILITGASSGIGEATARCLAEKGARLMLGARRDARLQNLVTELRDLGQHVSAQSLDVTDRCSVTAFVRAAVEAHGRVDVLVNNAGIMRVGPLAEGRVDDWDCMIDVNIRGPLNCIAEVLPLMEAQGSGQVINIASAAAFVAQPGNAVYAATKFALRGLSEGLRKETTCVRTTCISPGAVISEIAEKATEDEAARARLSEFRATAIATKTIASAVLHVIEQPAEVDTNDIVIRPLAATG